MNLDVLKQGGYVPERYEVAKLNGYDIRIRPLATLVRSDQHCVYGIVAFGTHEHLRRLYSQDWVGTYLPEPVLVESLNGKWRAGGCARSPPGGSLTPPKPQSHPDAGAGHPTRMPHYHDESD